MKQLTDNVFIDDKRQGPNQGYVTTSDSLVLIDTPNTPPKRERN